MRAQSGRKSVNFQWSKQIDASIQEEQLLSKREYGFLVSGELNAYHCLLKTLLQFLGEDSNTMKMSSRRDFEVYFMFSRCDLVDEVITHILVLYCRCIDSLKFRQSISIKLPITNYFTPVFSCHDFLSASPHYNKTFFSNSFCCYLYCVSLRDLPTLSAIAPDGGGNIPLGEELDNFSRNFAHFLRLVAANQKYPQVIILFVCEGTVASPTENEMKDRAKEIMNVVKKPILRGDISLSFLEMERLDFQGDLSRIKQIVHEFNSRLFEAAQNALFKEAMQATVDFQ